MKGNNRKSSLRQLCNARARKEGKDSVSAENAGNDGPVPKFPCGVCDKTVRWADKGIYCQKSHISYIISILAVICKC